MTSKISSLLCPLTRFLPCCLLALLAFAPGVARATTVVPPSFERLVNESDYIVRAVVKSVSSEWREKAGQRHIYTAVELEVVEVIVGTPPQPLVLQFLGGRVGEEELEVHGVPKFTVGQEDILFIRGNGVQFCPLSAVMHGRYPIEHDAGGVARVVRNNHVPLQDSADVSQPMAESNRGEVRDRARLLSSALTPENFIAHIRSVRAPNAGGRYAP